MLRHKIVSPWLFGQRLLKSINPISKQGLRIFLFHDIPPHQFKDFDLFITLLENLYSVITPKDAEDWLAGRLIKNDKKDLCLITFDDGFSSNFQIAKDILAKHDISALFFVCPKLAEIGGDQQKEAISARIFNGDHEQINKITGPRLMTWQELSELSELGHIIGSHGNSHGRLSELTADELTHEIIDAGNMIEKYIGKPVDWYAFAFGDIKSISQTALKIISERYKYCRSGIRGRNFVQSNPLGLFADSIDLNAPSPYQELVLEGGLDYFYYHARRRLNKITPEGG
jgi:peptidoglycan/xylan/chitin deacetylase (PgdA/CDA1 family)